MSANFLTKTMRGRKTLMILGLPLWVFVSFMLAQAVVSYVVIGIDLIWPLDEVNSAVLQLVVSMAVYAVTLLITIGVPAAAFKKKTNRNEIGLSRLPTWTDIGLAPAAFVLYAVLSGALITILSELIPALDLTQEQNVGFENLSTHIEYLVAFTALVVVAPLAEEILFRGYLYGKLRRAVPVVLAAIVTSLLFGAVHGQWNVAIDTFVLSLVMCALREFTGSIWAGILLHMLKNAVAFFILFIYPNMTL